MNIFQLLKVNRNITSSKKTNTAFKQSARRIHHVRSLKSCLHYGLYIKDYQGQLLYIIDKTAPKWSVFEKWLQKHNQNKNILQPSKQDYYQQIAKDFSAELKFLSRWYLKKKFPHFSCEPILTKSQIIFLTSLFFVFIISMVLSLKWTVLFISTIATLCFLILSTTRIIAATQFTNKKHKQSSKIITSINLPSFTLLIPLYDEANVLPQLVKALKNINYPTSKLEIFLLIEENDSSMRTALDKIYLPSNFTTHIIPKDKLQTKPRALNYGLIFSKGDIISVYDAEDIPDPEQLNLVADCFSKANTEKIACVQAQLMIYNEHQNWLTKMFAFEYDILFKAYLPFLYKMKWAIPLGGTSNHFRADILKAIGGWDAHNVAEDADLGIRLHREGYETALIDSQTSEEALTHLPAWLRQRSRWLKGWMQSYAVHMRNPIELYKTVGMNSFIGLQVVMGIMITSILSHPLFCFVFLVELYYIMQAVEDVNNYNFIISFVTLMIGYISYGYLGLKVIKNRKLSSKIFFLITLPAYWLLTSISGYLAIYDLAYRPFHWHKSPHKGKLEKKHRKKRKYLARLLKHYLYIYGSITLKNKHRADPFIHYTSIDN